MINPGDTRAQLFPALCLIKCHPTLPLWFLLKGSEQSVQAEWLLTCWDDSCMEVSESKCKGQQDAQVKSETRYEVKGVQRAAFNIIAGG